MSNITQLWASAHFAISTLNFYLWIKEKENIRRVLQIYIFWLFKLLRKGENNELIINFPIFWKWFTAQFSCYMGLYEDMIKIFKFIWNILQCVTK